MVVILKKNSSKKEIAEAQKRFAQKRKKSSLSEFYGKMKGKFGDGLSYQKKLRDEWD